MFGRRGCLGGITPLKMAAFKRTASSGDGKCFLITSINLDNGMSLILTFSIKRNVSTKRENIALPSDDSAPKFHKNLLSELLLSTKRSFEAFEAQENTAGTSIASTPSINSPFSTSLLIDSKTFWGIT